MNQNSSESSFLKPSDLLRAAKTYLPKNIFVYKLDFFMGSVFDVMLGVVSRENIFRFCHYNWIAKYSVFRLPVIALH